MRSVVNTLALLIGVVMGGLAAGISIGVVIKKANKINSEFKEACSRPQESCLPGKQ